MKQWYVFVGQDSVTCGTTNKITGLQNCYGDLVCFDSKKERDNYYNNFYDDNGFTQCIKTNKHDAKSKFFAGMSQREFNDYLQYVNSDCNYSHNNKQF